MTSQGLKYLESRLMFGMVPGLESTKKICKALENPQKSFDSIHVVGTNGKGSTSFYLSGILQVHGIKTGLFTSPHLVSIRERIRVNDVPISDYDLDRLLILVKKVSENLEIEPTFFEVLTIVCFLYFKEQNVEFAVLEAGMGGRLDSTAVAMGRLAVVTSIGLEHTEVLGNTESLILKEKLGVLSRESKEIKVFILGGLSQYLLEEAKKYCKNFGAICTTPKVRTDIELPNLGEHYKENASLALNAASIILDSKVYCLKNKNHKLYDDSLSLTMLKNRSWPGRMQLLKDSQEKLKYIIDGTHNAHAAKRLKESLDKFFPRIKFPCIFGVLKDKDFDEMLKLLQDNVSEWILVRTDYPRFKEPKEVAEYLISQGQKVTYTGTLTSDILKKFSVPILVTGSLYMVGSVIEMLKNDFSELSFFREFAPSTNEHR